MRLTTKFRSFFFLVSCANWITRVVTTVFTNNIKN